MYLIKKRRSTDAQYLLLTLCLEVQKRSLTNVLHVGVLKNCVIFTGKHCAGVSL